MLEGRQPPLVHRGLLLLLLLHAAVAPELSAASAATTCPPPRWEREQRPAPFEWVDEAARISVAKAFVSKAERDYILALIQDEAGGWAPSATGGAGFMAPASSKRFQAAARRDPVIARLEARIANATGIAPHGLEDMLSVARIKSRGNTLHAGHYTPFGLHHETDGRPYRAKTVLLYLAAPKAGGRTIFPLIAPPAAALDVSTPIGQRHADFREALLSMWGEKEQSYARQAAIDPEMMGDHPFMDLLASACRGEYGVSIKPTAGMALQFEHILPDGSYNRDTWHDGCNVLSGAKITLQKFKELPSEHRQPGDQGIYQVDSGIYKGKKLQPVTYSAWDPDAGYAGFAFDEEDDDDASAAAAEAAGDGAASGSSASARKPAAAFGAEDFYLKMQL